MNDYHDATLISAVLEWESGKTILTFELCTEPAQLSSITVTGTSKFEFNRQFPWGKSLSVNGVGRNVGERDQLLEVEMQSGDKIVVRGQEIFETINTL
jgi:hypothetical protein